MATTVALMAVPARREGVWRTQADGTKIWICQHGDERFHWLTNAQGEWLEQQDGMYRTVPALSDEQIALRRASSRYHTPAAAQTASPLNIAPRGLIILVNFSDKSFATDRSEIDSMILGQNYTRKYSYSYYNESYRKVTINVDSKGSATQYFHDVSYGQYNPKFDIVGPVTLSNKATYYGKNTMMVDDAYAYKMVEEAAQLAYEQYDIDWSLYDNDGDQEVDFIYFLYAGYGEADGGGDDVIWPHKGSLVTDWKVTNYKVNGYLIDNYACSNEISYISDYHDGIGTFCHEFGHVLGLPDLYATNGSSIRTLHDWDIMDYGCYNGDSNTPCAYSGYERFFCGWATPQILTDSAYYELNELNSSNTVLLISTTDEHNLIGNDPDPTTFYLLENRQQAGWDKELVGHGLMLTKINYSYTRWHNNTPNNYTSTMGVDIIEAKKNTSSSSNAATDLFPAGATAYTIDANHILTDITEQDGKIYFSYNGGKNLTPTAIDHADTEEQILGIYTLTGENAGTDLEPLHGVYIVRTNKRVYKVLR